MAQSVAGRDPFGHKIAQAGLPTAIDAKETIAISSVSPATLDLTLHRSGSVWATVSGKKKGITRTAWTEISARGTILRDNNKLGGVFLLPVPFLGDRSMNAGAALNVGDAWSGKLGIKLFGMMASPTMRFRVTGARALLGNIVYSIAASGSAPMKEPIVTNAGYAVGNASGTAWISLTADYDFTSRRAISMTVDVRDTLQLFGPKNKVAGTVRDRQRYAVEIDANSLMAGSRQPVSSDPPAPPAGQQ